MDPSHRLDRRTPGQWLHEEKLVEARVYARQVELRQPRTILGDSTEGRGFKVRKIKRVADPRPNAPQLIRLVRTPFKLHTSRPRRGEGRQPIPWEALRSKRADLVSRIVAAEGRALFQGNPLRAVDTRVQTRPRPSAQAWIDSRGM